MKKRLPQLDIAKGIAIILIVWAHSDIRMDPSFYQTYLYFSHEIIYSFHIPLFFMISGILAKSTLANPGFALWQYTQDLVERLLVPFYALSLVFLVINLIIPCSFIDKPSLLHMLLSLGIMQSHPEYLPSGVLWFLFTLFICAFLHAVVIKELKFNLYLWLAFTLFLALICHSFWDIYYFALDRTTRNLFYYVFGYAISDSVMTGQMWISVVFLFIMLALWLFGFVFFSQGYYACRTITGVSGSLLLLCLINQSIMEHPNWVSEKLMYLGENSIIVFVLHMPSLRLALMALRNFNLTNHLVGFAITVLSGIALPLLIGMILRKIPIAYKLFFGRWPKSAITTC